MAAQKPTHKGTKRLTPAIIERAQSDKGPKTANQNSLRRGRNLEHLSDRIALAVGSTRSFYVHLLFYGGLFALSLVGVALSTILLLVATIVSLEGVFLVIFVQRSANQQAARLEEAIVVIRHNTADHLNEPLDVVVKDIRRELRETGVRVAALSEILSLQMSMVRHTTVQAEHSPPSTPASTDVSEHAQDPAIIADARTHTPYTSTGTGDSSIADPTDIRKQPDTIDVLVVDDDRAIGDMVCTVLLECGYTALAVTSGQQALNLLASHKPRLILADLDMPAMSGWALCAWLQAHEHMGAVPIVLISGSAQLDREATLLGVQGYIAKPFDIDDLLRVVHKHLSER